MTPSKLNAFALSTITFAMFLMASPLVQAQTAPTSLPLQSIDFFQPTHLGPKYPTDTDDLVIENLPTYDNNTESISFHFYVRDVSVNGKDVSVRINGQPVNLGAANQVTTNEWGTTFTYSAGQYQLTYTHHDQKGWCPNRHDGLLPHFCSERREQFTLTNSSNTIHLSCVRWSEIGNQGADLPFEKTDSGLPNCG